MRIFVFEFITGGGWHLIDENVPPAGSLLKEGAAMLRAVVEDFAALPEAKVSILWDTRLEPDLSVSSVASRIVTVDSTGEVEEQLARCAPKADFTLVIAPEFDGHLLRVAQTVIAAGGRLLSPTPEFIRLTSDKHQVAERLKANGVPTPDGVLLKAKQSLPLGAHSGITYPAVLKPNDGAGSLNVRLLSDASRTHDLQSLSTPARLENYCPGIAASVAAIGGSGQWEILPPCVQRLSNDGRFSYLGGFCPLETSLVGRVRDLAKRALSVLSPTVGYVGMDLVLGDDPSGVGDVVIEVNPRLTTSYVGLRVLVRENLAATMLRMAQGSPAQLSSKPGRVEFSAGGEVRFCSE